MSVEYVASIAKADYSTFKIVLTTPLPDDYEMWLRVRYRGKLRALAERGLELAEIAISPIEFGEYCKRLKRPDFSIAGLDRCAREKALAQMSEPRNG
jgi:hypothetical protein